MTSQVDGRDRLVLSIAGLVTATQLAWSIVTPVLPRLRSTDGHRPDRSRPASWRLRSRADRGEHSRRDRREPHQPVLPTARRCARCGRPLRADRPGFVLRLGSRSEDPHGGDRRRCRHDERPDPCRRLRPRRLVHSRHGDHAGPPAHWCRPRSCRRRSCRSRARPARAVLRRGCGLRSVRAVDRDEPPIRRRLVEAGSTAPMEPMAAAAAGRKPRALVAACLVASQPSSAGSASSRPCCHWSRCRPSASRLGCSGGSSSPGSRCRISFVC